MLLDWSCKLLSNRRQFRWRFLISYECIEIKCIVPAKCYTVPRYISDTKLIRECLIWLCLLRSAILWIWSLCYSVGVLAPYLIFLPIDNVTCIYVYKTTLQVRFCRLLGVYFFFSFFKIKYIYFALVWFCFKCIMCVPVGLFQGCDKPISPETSHAIFVVRLFRRAPFKNRSRYERQLEFI